MHFSSSICYSRLDSIRGIQKMDHDGSGSVDIAELINYINIYGAQREEQMRMAEGSALV
jgi:hypothetical protein